jgi:Xaa-Pro aminopeptidase
MTRTFFHGTPTAEQKQVYDIVLQSQRAAVDYLKSSVANRKSGSPIKASKVDQVARDYIVSKGYQSIPHSLGHGIGLEVHEPPFIGPGSNDILSEGMVFSVEPGIYLSGNFGVRIEDLFVIKDGILKKLTNFPLASKI